MRKTLILLLICCPLFAKDKNATQYTMTLSVVSTKAVPFRSGAHSSSNTNCYFTGNEITCNTSDNSFQGIPGVEYVMLAHASDGNTYLFSCSAQWRWSHCTGLAIGQFHARLDGGALAIEYFDKGKAKEGKYGIMSMEATQK